MNIIKTDIPEVLIFEPRVFGDARGFFFESFSSKVFNEAVGRQVEFVQDNHSQSQKGVLRGLHYQLDPHAQGKLVRCVEGGGGYPSFIANLWQMGGRGAQRRE
jgi:dTDP-4-dehydrorhamnose 3,5-epimerase